MIDLREARYFVAVAEELHFGRAAGRLHMSQPPLSQVIKSLEHRLGTALFTRSTRSVALTAPGRVLLDHARRMIHLAEEAESATRLAGGGQLGTLRIGAVTSAFFDPLPGMLATFRAAHPRVEIILRELDTHEAARALRDHAIDVALVRYLATPTGLERATLLREDFVLAVPSAWDLPTTAPLDPLDLAAMADRPWIWLPRPISPDYHDRVATCCRANGFLPEITNTASSIVSQLAMVACDLGVALVPESSAEQAAGAQRRVRFVRLTRTSSIDLAALWRTGSGDPMTTAFVAAYHRS